ncbi:MAG: serine hydrolase domain-containing protein, partial [Bacteroidales bacterium]
MNKFKITWAIAIILSIVSLLAQQLPAQTIDVNRKLKGFDKTIEQVLKDWNVPGCGIGIVYKDQLVYARGFGYRDIEEKLPVTPNTLFHIASNTKLFTSVAIGLLVEDGKLEWDKPVRNWVPQLEFYNNELNNSVTIRDMLAHRTGISRHDALWIRSDFSRQELFERIKYLEPTIPLRQGYIYNNLMYVAAGQIIEILTGQTWEEYVQERIFNPLGMANSVFDVPEM